MPELRRRSSGGGALLSGLQAATRARAEGGAVAQGPVSDSHQRARKIKPQFAEGELVCVAGARNQAEAEFIQGMLLEEGLLDCLGYGAMLRSCLALAGCAALYGYTMP